jgi:valyl-tRNA synthetase
VRDLGHYLRRLARVAAAEAGPAAAPPRPAGTHTVGSGAVYVPLTQAHLEKERDRLRKDVGKGEAELVKIEQKLASQGFVAKAPPDVVAAVRADRDERIAALARLREHLAHVEAALAGG